MDTYCLSCKTLFKLYNIFYYFHYLHFCFVLICNFYRFFYDGEINTYKYKYNNAYAKTFIY